MKHYKSLTALLIAGLLLLSACDKTPSEVSEGDASQSEIVSEAVDSDIKSDINSEYTSSVEEKSAPESSEIEESSEEPSEESSEQSAEESSEEPSEEPSKPSWPIGTRAYELDDTGYVCVQYTNSGRAALADKNGKMLTKFEYKNIFSTPYYIALIKKGYCKVVDLKLNTIIEGNYDITTVRVREYMILTPSGSDLFSLYNLEGKQVENLPKFKGIQFYSLGYTDLLYIISEDDTLHWYQIDNGVFKPYDVDAALEKHYYEVINPLSMFMYMVRNDNYEGMRRYATKEIVDSYAEYRKNPDSNNTIGKIVNSMNYVTKDFYIVYPDGYTSLLYVENEAEGRYACSFRMSLPRDAEEGLEEPTTFYAYFTTVSDGKGGLLIDSIARKEDLERYSQDVLTYDR